jgi:oligoribonuclease
MKYVSIDIETSGIDPEKHQILEFSAIIEDTKNPLSFDEIPKFNAKFFYKEIIGEPIALAMNTRLLEIFSIYDKIDNLSDRAFFREEENIYYTTRFPEPNNAYNNAWSDFKKMLSLSFSSREKITIAGKNFAIFDMPFLIKTSTYWDKDHHDCIFNRRIIDVANFYINFLNDDVLPNTEECIKRSNLNLQSNHDSMMDAWNVIQLLRLKY